MGRILFIGPGARSMQAPQAGDLTYKDTRRARKPSNRLKDCSEAEQAGMDSSALDGMWRLISKSAR